LIGEIAEEAHARGAEEDAQQAEDEEPKEQVDASTPEKRREAIEEIAQGYIDESERCRRRCPLS
jgi:hypothetical protein